MGDVCISQSKRIYLVPALHEALGIFLSLMTIPFTQPCPPFLKSTSLISSPRVESQDTTAASTRKGGGCENTVDTISSDTVANRQHSAAQLAKDLFTGAGRLTVYITMHEVNNLI